MKDLKYKINIGLGLARGVMRVNAYGKNTLVGTGEESLTELGGLYTYTTSGVLHYISSADDTDTQEYEIHGLDEKKRLQTVTVTAVGQTQTAIPNLWYRIFYVKNKGTTDSAGVVYVYENDTVTAGVPQTLTKIRAKIIVGENKSTQAIYTIPLGYRGLLTKVDFTSGKNQDTDVHLHSRIDGEVFALEYEADIYRGVVGREYDLFPVFEEGTDLELRAHLDAGENPVSGSFDLLLIDTSKYKG